MNTPQETLRIGRRYAVSLLVGWCLCLLAASASAQERGDEDGGETGDDEIAVPKVLGGSVSNTETIDDRKPEAIHEFTDWLWDLPVII
ncbi:MAG: hypothetical protein ACR2RV_00135, partial [Verrucomicrobiales bacterium]